MPAVPAATVVITSSSTSSSRTSSDTSQQTVQHREEPRSFTVLENNDDDFEEVETLHPINIIEVDHNIQYLNDDEEEEEEVNYGRHFRTSHPDHQSLNSSNVYLLQRKLMDLSQSNGNLQEKRLFTRTNGYLKHHHKGHVKVNNNLNGQKLLSKSNGNIQQTPQRKLKKDCSKSYSNLHKNQPYSKNNNLYQNQKVITKSYHRNCYTSTSVYNSKSNMTSVKQPSVYNRDFSNISDTKPQRNGFNGRRKSSQESDQSMSPFNNSNNNNNINSKNRHNESNNRYLNNNQYNNSKNAMNTRINNQNKPLFVTTVKSGTFLDPPPELAYILGLNNASSTAVSSPNESNNSLENSIRDKHQQQVLLYSFSSQPRVLHQHLHRARCEAAKAAKNNIVASHQRARRDTNATLNSSGGMDADKKSNNEQDGPVPYGNIMFDRRVVRGSTFAQHPIPPKWNPYFGYAKLLSKTDGESQAARQQEARRRALARRRAQGQQTRNARYRIGTPPPVAGRRHENVQTEKFLEELFDRPLESEIGVQTDLFLDRPPSPFYVPAKTGVDAETQIYPGDLFDFDMEVQPILEVLVGKTIEQAMMEVLEEEEIAALRAQQRRFLELRAGEKAEQLRLEVQERRLREEKERRIAEQKLAIKVKKETEERVAAAVLTHGYLADLLPSVLEGLKEAGYLLDDIKLDVADNFMPWLMNEVQLEMDNMVSSRDILTDMVREILETRAEIYRVMGEEEAAKLNLDSDEEQAPEQTAEEEDEGAQAPVKVNTPPATTSGPDDEEAGV